jgi:taurine dioxygenase
MVPYKSICVTPASPHIGAEISNIDLTKPLSQPEVADLHKALEEHLVIFFRDQEITPTMLKVLGEHFGQLHEHVGKRSAALPMAGDPIVRILHFDEKSEQIAGGEVWHTDQSCAQIPPMGSILYLHTVPPNGGGDTMFASMYAAYDALSDRMKSYLQGLTAIHDGTPAFGPGEDVISRHPLIVRNPLTGRKSIFFTPSFIRKIDAVPADESAAIISFLSNHCAHPDFQCRFRWRQHSIAFWDNRYSHHRALWDYYPNVRSGFRIQIQGTVAPLAA